MRLRFIAPARVLIALLLLSSLSLGGCRDTLNVGGDLPLSKDYFANITAFTVVPKDPAGLYGLEEATFTVEWTGGGNPAYVAIDFGGCASPNISGVPASSPFSTTVRLLDADEEATFVATARVTSSIGITSNARTLDFTVGTTRNADPSIDSIVVESGIVTVTVSDIEGDAATLTLDSVSGSLSGSPASIAIPNGNGSVEFSFVSLDVLAGASGAATFSLNDLQHGGSDTQTSPAIMIPPPLLPMDGLAAIPLAGEATTEDTVKVVIATGPVANPFQFMTGVSVVFPPGCDYSGNSFDFGAPVAGDPGLNPVEDKDQETVDGIWTLVNPASGFLGVGDNLLVPDTVLPAPFEGMSAIDFNITPLGGSDAPAGSSGILFNFNIEFSAAGTYKLGFLLFDEINRTYYQDGSQTVYQWSDLTNTSTQDTVTVSAVP